MDLVGVSFPRLRTKTKVNGMVTANTTAISAAIIVGDQNPEAFKVEDTVKNVVAWPFVTESTAAT